MMSAIVLRAARASDAPAARSLLAAAGLPSELEPHWFPDDAIIAHDGDAIAGLIALERAGDAGLLRSLVVAPARRGTGLGARLVAECVAIASRNRIGHVHLLTTDAADFFARLGFARVARDDAPTALRQTSQFTGLCPASAICMRRASGPAGSAITDSR